MKVNYVFAKNNADLLKIQDKAIRAANSARVTIQIALIATIKHLADNHDVRVARRLVDGLHETVRGKALVDYLCKYGHLTVGTVTVQDDKGKDAEVMTFDGIKGDAAAHSASIAASFDEAKATFWWMLKKENPYRGFSLEEALQNVIAQNKRAMEKVAKGQASADQVQTKVNDSTIKAVLSLCNFDAIIDELPEDSRKVA